MNAEIVWLTSHKAVEAVPVGGKGQGLLNLAKIGLPIPPGFIIPSAFFPPTTIDQIKEQLNGSTGNQVNWQPIEAAYQQLQQKNPAVAVRSSALAEDGPQHSFAGLHDTFLWVSGISNLLPKITACWASLFSKRAQAYRLERQITAVPQMAVIVQQMVPAQSSGVMMTLNPSNGDRSKIVIEATWGLGQPLVEGAITPDRFLLDKVTGQLISSEIASKMTELRPTHSPPPTVANQPVPPEKQTVPSLTDDQLNQLWIYGRQLETTVGTPQDIEFALADDKIYLLQSRPETYWQQQPQQPVNLPTKPIDQIVATLANFGQKGGKR
ncbi:PEP/pyruvate-binding domain-containing protein [Candidatus Leptofilum sp.]|uniref:PEP/pyruvate-binding domain-containing protein n=1 Tax=Candidatus Leptofilum sp. TaxID=3241576 RepID=UPI003B59BC4A